MVKCNNILYTFKNTNYKANKLQKLVIIMYKEPLQACKSSDLTIVLSTVCEPLLALEAFTFLGGGVTDQ